MGAICEIIREDGELARLDDLIPFAEKHNLKIITIEALIHWRRKKERLVHPVSKAQLPTKYGQYEIITYISDISDEYSGFSDGKIKPEEPILQECIPNA